MNLTAMTYTLQRGLRGLRLMGSYWLRRTRVGYPPFTLIVEPTNVCNLQCRMCCQKNMMRPRGFMSMQVAETIACQAAEIGVRHVQFAFGGEPTLHRDLAAMVELFECRGIKIELFTNATRLDRELGQALIDAGLSMINFSVDGFDAATYEKIRPPARFDTVVANIRTFAELVDGYSGKCPYRRLYVTPQTANREQLQAGLEKKVFGHLVDGYYYNAPNNWTGAVDGSVIGEQHPSMMNRCMYVWVMMVVAHDGRIAPCPCDYEVSCDLGSVTASHLKEVWRGEGIRRLRGMGQGNDDDLPAICRACLWRQASGPVHLLLKRVRSELRVALGRVRTGPGPCGEREAERDR